VIAVLLSSNNNLQRDYDPGTGDRAWDFKVQLLERSGQGGNNIFGGSVDSGDTRVTAGGVSEIDCQLHTNAENQEVIANFAGIGAFALVKGRFYSFVARQSQMNFNPESNANGSSSKSHIIHATYIISYDTSHGSSNATLGDWNGE